VIGTHTDGNAAIRNEVQVVEQTDNTPTNVSIPVGDMVVCRFLQVCDQFTGVDGRSYPPGQDASFSMGDIATIPRQNATILVDRSIVTLVNNEVVPIVPLIAETEAPCCERPVEPEVWRHPEYSDERIASMTNEECCTALQSLQSLPRNSDLMMVETLRTILSEAVVSERIHARYVLQQEQDERERELQRSARRHICITDMRMREISDRTLDALYIANDPSFIFVRTNGMVRVRKDENNIPCIDTLSKYAMRGIIDRCAEFTKITNNTREAVIAPPMDIVEDVMSLPSWDLPPLKGIIETPYITADGNIVSTAGYNSKSKLFFAPQENYTGVTVPDNPTKDDVLNAKKLLFDLFSDFQFEDEASKENNIACLITATIRPIIEGVVPLAIYDKPVMGCGASLLADIIARITTGRTAAMTTTPQRNNPEEWEKVIVSIVREGRSFVVLDNIEGDFYNPHLASVLTTLTYKGRILSKNEMPEYPNIATWIANGNNLKVTGDLPRRCYWIRMSTDTARPFSRKDFKISDIRKHVIDNRSRYLSAILTIAKAWFNAGKPGAIASVPVMGGFEAWRSMIGGIMGYMDCKNFLINTEEKLDECEVQYADEEKLLETLFAQFPSTDKTSVGFTTSEIGDKLKLESNAANKEYQNPIITEALPGNIKVILNEKPGSVNKAIGTLFGKINGRVFQNGYRLKKGKVSHGVIKWSVENRASTPTTTQNQLVEQN